MLIKSAALASRGPIHKRAPGPTGPDVTPSPHNAVGHAWPALQNDIKVTNLCFYRYGPDDTTKAGVVGSGPTVWLCVAAGHHFFRAAHGSAPTSAPYRQEFPDSALSTTQSFGSIQ